MKNRKRIVGLVTLYLLGATLSLNTTAQAQSGLGKIYGVAFIDANGNGRRDAGEPTTLGRYKITSIGGYWTCGHTGSDDTYGVTVRPGVYYVMPIAGPDQHTSAPVIRVEVQKPGDAVVANLPLVPLKGAPAENCGAYAPRRIARVPWGIPETAIANGLTTLSQAIEVAELFDVMSSPGPFTVFAPTNGAFAKLGEQTLNTVLADKALLTSILTYHVVPGKFSANDVVNSTSLPTVNGTRLSVKVRDGEVFVDNARVIATDVVAGNGIVHVIDSVLLP